MRPGEPAACAKSSRAPWYPDRTKEECFRFISKAAEGYPTPLFRVPKQASLAIDRRSARSSCGNICDSKSVRGDFGVNGRAVPGQRGLGASPLLRASVRVAVRSASILGIWGVLSLVVLVVPETAWAQSPRGGADDSGQPPHVVWSVGARGFTAFHP